VSLTGKGVSGISAAVTVFDEGTIIKPQQPQSVDEFGIASGLPDAVGDGWYLVGRISPDGGMFDGNSNLSLQYNFGTYSNDPYDTSDFYRTYPGIAPGEILFITGDNQYWGRTNYDVLKGVVDSKQSDYSASFVWTISTDGISERTANGSVLSRNTSNYFDKEDPWIALEGAHNDVSGAYELMVWGETNYPVHTSLKAEHDGVNLYVRDIPGVGIGFPTEPPPPPENPSDVFFPSFPSGDHTRISIDSTTSFTLTFRGQRDTSEVSGFDLINPVQTDSGKIFYWMDTSQDGSSAGDVINHDFLDHVFNNGNDTSASARSLDLGEITLHLPTYEEVMDLIQDQDSTQPVGWGGYYLLADLFGQGHRDAIFNFDTMAGSARNSSTQEDAPGGAIVWVEFYKPVLIGQPLPIDLTPISL
jgi:hypothetical protein